MILNSFLSSVEQENIFLQKLSNDHEKAVLLTQYMNVSVNTTKENRKNGIGTLFAVCEVLI